MNFDAKLTQSPHTLLLGFVDGSIKLPSYSFGTMICFDDDKAAPRPTKNKIDKSMKTCKKEEKLVSVQQS